ncbi:MAG: TlpA disulfide reductase family protein [Steroidobacteraceae bacterium]
MFRSQPLALTLLLVAGAVIHALDASAAERHALIGKPAPDFALRSAAGPNLRLSEQRGDVVVLSFWSSRCNTCRLQLAELDRLYATYRPAGFVVFGIGVDDDAARAVEFVRAQGASFPMLFDPAKQIARSFDIDNLPMLVAIDRFGVVRLVRRDDRRSGVAEYTAALRRLLDE